MTEENRETSVVAALRARALEALRFHPREVVALAILALAITGGAALAYARTRPAPAESLAPVAAPSVEPSKPPTILVHVVGAIHKPGVYRFDEGARVVDAVRAAGGFASGADKQAVNLARALTDGEQIVVPRKGEAPPPPAGGGSTGGSAHGGGKINVNLATVADLDGLPGIGPVLAQRIVDYREQHGPFRNVRDLMKVPGIGPRKYESFESMVTV